jgi:hypothetical protein
MVSMASLLNLDVQYIHRGRPLRPVELQVELKSSSFGWEELPTSCLFVHRVSTIRAVTTYIYTLATRGNLPSLDEHILVKRQSLLIAHPPPSPGMSNSHVHRARAEQTCVVHVHIQHIYIALSRPNSHFTFTVGRKQRSRLFISKSPPSHHDSHTRPPPPPLPRQPGPRTHRPRSASSSSSTSPTAGDFRRRS